MPSTAVPGSVDRIAALSGNFKSAVIAGTCEVLTFWREELGWQRGGLIQNEPLELLPREYRCLEQLVLGRDAAVSLDAACGDLTIILPGRSRKFLECGNHSVS